MPDSYTSVTQHSWGSRIKDSLAGAVLGFCLFLAAFPVLFLNEGRSVYEAEKLEHGKSVVISIDADRVVSENEGKLVHVTGKATTDATLTDEVLGVKVANAIKLQRVVEMYQWQESSTSETDEHHGGSATTKTTYNYDKEWSANYIDSSQFSQSGYDNPSMQIRGNKLTAQQVTLGEFSLSKDFIGEMNNYQLLPMAAETQAQVLEKLSAHLGDKKTQVHGDYYYVSETPSHPQLGDLRIQFEVVWPDIISVVAKQAGSRLETYTTEQNYSLEFLGFKIVDNHIQLFEYGEVTASAMFEHAKQANTFWTWIFRGVGFFMMFIGLSMIFGVLQILAAVIPFFGSIVGFIGSLIAFVIATMLSLITIAMAWLFYRPMLSVILIAIAGVGLYLLTFLRKKPQQQPMMVFGTGVPQPMLVPQQGVLQPMVMPQGVQPVMAQQMPMYQGVPQQAVPQQMPMYQGVFQQAVPQQMAMPQGVFQQAVPQQRAMPQGVQPVMTQQMPQGVQQFVAQPAVMPQGVPQQVVIAQPTDQPMVMPQSVQPVVAQPMVMPQGVQQTGVPQNLNLAPLQQYGEATAVTQQQSPEEPILVPEAVVPKKS